MRTTISADKKLLEDVCKAAGEKSLNKAVKLALTEYVRRRKLKELRNQIGKLGLADNWRESEEAELEEMRRMIHGTG